MYEDGTNVYPGIADIPKCDGIHAARISVNKNKKLSGGFVGCEGQHFCDRSTSKFFVFHKDLKWVMTNTEKSGDDVRGAIKIYFDAGDYQFVARVNVTKNGKTFQQIGFYYAEDVCYWNSQKYVCRTGNFEILACQYKDNF